MWEIVVAVFLLQADDAPEPAMLLLGGGCMRQSLSLCRIPGNRRIP